MVERGDPQPANNPVRFTTISLFFRDSSAVVLLLLNGAADYTSMDNQQTKIVELLREMHLIAIKEIERLNLRVAELENLAPKPNDAPEKTTILNPATVDSAAGNPEIINELQVAEYIGMSVASVRRWRTIRNGPKFLKIGSAVRYKRKDVEEWLDVCAGLL
jgi:predicted DNA-binding transcriptional regulator AlpA